MATESEPRPTITKVWAKNFRSIEYAELELDPLTVLAGPNASGKSNLLDVLGFLADASRDGLEMALNKRGGIDSIGRRSPGRRVLAPEIGFHAEVGGVKFEYNVSLMTRGKTRHRIKREYAKLHIDTGRSPTEVEIIGGRLSKPNLDRISREFSTPTKDASAIKRLIAEEEVDREDINLISENALLFLLPLAFMGGPGKESAFKNPYFFLQFVLGIARTHLSHSAMYHIFPNALRHPQKVAESYPLATGGENLASTLRDMAQKKSSFLPELKEALSVAVPGIRDIRVKKAGSYYVVELEHERNDGVRKGLWFDLAQESDGTIRLLAMLTALFQDPAPSLMGLEEPELAIHPGAMAVLADTMKEASLRGQVLVATHSPDLINLLPIESIRAVTAQDGSTRVGKVAEHQLKSVKDNLFLPGELHSMEGLQPAGAGKPAE